MKAAREVRNSWEWQLNWPGATGGFVGRTQRPDGEMPGAPDRLAAALAEVGARTLIEAEQVHGNLVAPVTQEMLPRAQTSPGGTHRCLEITGADGLLTDLPGVALAIYVADCLAIWLHDAERGVIGLAHAGWRGLAADMPGSLVRGALAYGGEPEDLRIALSPCIRACCFEVGEEVAAAFEHVPDAVDRSLAKPHVDMIRVAQWQLGQAGVRPEQIETVEGCTRCEPERFASYRWDSERCGRNVALIAAT